MWKRRIDEHTNGSRTRGILHAIAGAALVLLLAAPAGALPIEASAGSGPDLATVVLEFQDGAGYVFEVAFDDAVATSGIDILQVLESDIASFSVTVVDFGFGLFVDGIAYAGHSDGGFGGGDLFWHYWTKESAADPWLESSVGAASRVVLDGAWDGWRFGAGAPVPEPGTGVLVAVGLVVVARRRAAGRRG